MTTIDNNKRIAKNTLLLYFRMLFMMIVSLYTSRIVLNTLGIEDFGIYNVVGGIVIMFSFINLSMASATQRFLTFELGKNDLKQLQVVFFTSVVIHIVIAIIVFLLAITVGFWFFYAKLSIPVDRLEAATWVYFFSVLSSIVMILSVPYNAVIIAHEKMNIFAYISILEALLKLLVVYLLIIFTFDKLKIYAILVFIVQLIIRFIYGFYCRRNFTEVRYNYIYDKKIVKEMISFAGWSLWGNFANIAFTQGINMILNIFFGPIVNAARGIAVQVQQTVNSFATNFQTALNPQITKSYANKDYDYMYSLIYRSSKFSFFLLFFLSLPVFIEAEMLLTIWLKTVPEYTVTFVRLMLCITIIDATANPFMISASATGKIRLYQSLIGGLLIAIVPFSYIVLKMGGSPSSVFIVHLVIVIIAFNVRLLIVKPLINLSIYSYFKYVIIKIILVVLLSTPIPVFLYMLLPENIYSFILVIAMCFVCVGLFIYLIGLNKAEQNFFKGKMDYFFFKMKR